MQDLLPGYEHDIEPGAGLGVGAGGDKVVIHTTESPRGSFNAIRNLWRGSNNWGKGLPTFLADGPRLVQLLPLNTNAYTLENKAGGADTNRAGHVIQVEWCRYSADPWADDELRALAKWLVDLKAAGLNIDINHYPRFYGANEGVVLASYGSPIRMGAQQWTDFNGWCGHQHAPENAHWDPGYLDAAYVARLAAELGMPVNTKPEEGEVTVIMWGAGGAYAVNGLFKKGLTEIQMKKLKYIGVKDLGRVDDDILAVYSNIPNTIAGS
jgi:hypothetical protein